MQSVFFGKKNTSNNCYQVLTTSLFSRYWNTTNIVKNDNEIINKKIKRQIPMTIIIHNNDAISNSDDMYYDTNDDTKKNINDIYYHTNDDTNDISYHDTKNNKKDTMVINIIIKITRKIIWKWLSKDN